MAKGVLLYVKDGLLLMIAVLATLVLASPERLSSEPKSYWRPLQPVRKTNGEPWPKPQNRVLNDGYMILRPAYFRFQVVQKNCDLLQTSLKRYYKEILRSHYRTSRLDAAIHRENAISGAAAKQTSKNAINFRGYLDELRINLLSECEDMPHPDMDEHYILKIDTEDVRNGAQLVATSIWGVLRGLETFTQLFHNSIDGVSTCINSTWIEDFPRFRYRGILLDTSRHYLPVDIIKTNLELMEINKMNVFHWHIVDDQSFPFQSSTFPKLSEFGAYNPYSHIYSRTDVKEVIEYARQRGIRVVVEFDTPGHTESWGKGYPDLLTECFDQTGKPDGHFGPINPIRNTTYAFLKKLFSEVSQLFPDQYIHLGGDEVDYQCWLSNAELTKFMQTHNMTGSKDLFQYYLQRLVNIVGELKPRKSYIVWQEVFDDGVVLPKDAVIHVWKGGNYKDVLKKVTAKGYQAILSAPWYLDYISYRPDWPTYYQSDPHDFQGSPKDKGLVVGGEACLWAEFVNENNLIPRLWPRASAVAERLWSSKDLKRVDLTNRRMEEHSCRMVSRGYKVQPPSGPGFCEVPWQK